MGIGFSLALSLVDIFDQLKVRRGEQLYRLTNYGLIPLETRCRRSCCLARLWSRNVSAVWQPDASRHLTNRLQLQ